MRSTRIVMQGEKSILETQSALRNTWLLLSLTLLFSSAFSVYGMHHPASGGTMLVTFIMGFVLLFVTTALRNSVWGLVSIFAFTGCMGYSLGPMLNQFIRGYTNGGQLIMTAVGGTGLVFLVATVFTVTSRRELSHLGKALTIGLVVCIVAMLANIFFKMPALQLAISSLLVVISSLLIMYDTSRIVHGGETNYIMATISLYLDILVLFQNLLFLLGALTGRRD